MELIALLLTIGLGAATFGLHRLAVALGSRP